jgi:DNA polymerase-3 subunit alpha
MEASKDYSFNKAHAACYALIAYRTAWLKANYPCEYMAALISSVMNTKDRVPFYVNACDEMGIEVLPPDVNSSAVDFAVVEKKIRFGLNAVKNVGETAAQRIVAARQDGGPFTSIWDFTERVDPQVVNKRSLESLVKCGALDSTGASRMGMLSVLEQALAHGQKLAQDRLMGQSSLFEGAFDSVETAYERHYPPMPSAEFDKQELLRLEKETLGLYVSEHPLSAVREQLRRKTDATLAELERRRDGEVVTVGGITSEVKHLTTKRGDPMVFLTLDDPTGSAEIVVFSSTYQAARELCVTDRILVVKGRVDHKQQGETKVIASEVTAFEAVSERREVRFSLDAREAPAGVIRELARLVREFPGESPVYLSLSTSEGPKTFALGPEFKVRPDPDFIAEARSVLGGSAVLS